MVKKPTRKRTAAKRKPHDPSQRKARGLLTVGTSLPHLAAPALRKRGFAQAKLITDWPAIVGEELARETVPQKLAFPRGSKTDAVLHLRVASGFALELQHIAPQIIDRINNEARHGALVPPLARWIILRRKDEASCKLR